jgi:hypothetical protein
VNTQYESASPDTIGVLRKIILTVSTGGVTFLITDLAQQPLTWAIMLSVLVGGITLLVQFLVDFEQRQHVVERRLAQLERVYGDRTGALERTMRHEISRVNKATELFDQLEQSSLRVDSVFRLVRMAAAIPPERPELAHKLAQAQLDSLGSLLDQIIRGEDVSYDGEDRDWLLSLARSVTRTLDATSRSSVAPDGMRHVDEGFWDSDLSHRYVEHQREAIRRGVAIRRIFMLEHGDLAQTEELRRVCDQQLAIGVQVRTLDISKLGAARRMLVTDLVIFDEEITYELSAGLTIGATSAPYFVRTRLVLHPDLVKDQVQRYRDLWELSSEYE